MIKEQLKMLLSLQKYEERKAALVKKKQTFSSEGLKKTWQDVAILKNHIAQQKEKLSLFTSQSEKIEDDLSAIITQLKKLEVQLFGNGLKNHKEMSVLRGKYDTLQNSISLHENELLENMDRSDELKKVIANLNEQLAEKIHLHEEKQLNTLKDLTAIDQLLADIDKQIAECTQRIDNDLFSTYSELKRSISNPIAVLKSDYCSGCHRSLPLTKIEAAKVGVIHCDNCGRILVIEEK